MKKFLPHILITAAVLTAVFVFRIPLADLFGWFGSREAVVNSIRGLGAWGPFVLILLLILQVFLAFIPGQALMVACGYIFGFWGGMLISWTGLFLGGEIAFFLARHHGRPFAERWISPQILSKWDKAANGQGVGFYALSLVLPVFPNDAMCYVAGLGKIQARRFALANGLGRGVACLLMSAAGAFGGQLGILEWSVIAVLIVVALVCWFAVQGLKPGFLAI